MLEFFIYFIGGEYTVDATIAINSSTIMIINDTLFKNMAKTNPILPTTNNKLLAKVLVFFQILSLLIILVVLMPI